MATKKSAKSGNHRKLYNRCYTSISLPPNVMDALIKSASSTMRNRSFIIAEALRQYFGIK